MDAHLRVVIALRYLVIFSAPLLLIAGQRQGGLANLAAVLATFGLVPVIDLLLGKARPSGSVIPLAPRRLPFRAITWLVVPVQLGVIGWAAWVAGHGDLRGWELAALALSTGSVTGTMGITVAHELIHRDRRWERALGDVLLISVCYHHWRIEHLAGHHRRVATADDPATARLGESLYRFLPRTLREGFQDAWALEARRLARAGCPAWDTRNRLLRGLLATGLLVAGIWLALGTMAAAFFVIQGAVAILHLEVINYVQHYGLVRPRLPNGTWGPLTDQHSWNSRFRFSSWGLFELQRHSDHHSHAHRPYEQLRLHPTSPELPMGYGVMMVLALVPPLWHRVMDPRVQALRAAQERARPERLALRAG